MNKLLLTSAVVGLLTAGPAVAGTPLPLTLSPTSNPGHFTLMLGLGVEFGDSHPDVGVTGKVLVGPFSNVVAGGGVTYLFGSQQIGLDLSAGLNLNGATVLGGYDFTTQRPQVSVGYGPTLGGSLTCPSGYNLQGTTCYLDASDRRLKRDIVHLATLSDGIKLYSFRYLWSDEYQLG